MALWRIRKDARARRYCCWPKNGGLSGETGKCRYTLRAPSWEFGKFRAEKNAAERAEVERLSPLRICSNLGSRVTRRRLADLDLVDLN